MSAAIKKMLADRAKLAEQDSAALSPRKQEELDLVLRMIDTAKPFIDEHATDPKKWLPSALLRIGYCLISTGDNSRDALDFVVRHLNVARDRYKAGLDPNPFCGAPCSGVLS